ncbi:MAG TPA: hypothetical protein DHN33_07225, partial [Eubacteriaceae bacterium]|nr:hypothetical protein [Eubacteriaceae bacterium]
NINGLGKQMHVLEGNIDKLDRRMDGFDGKMGTFNSRMDVFERHLKGITEELAGQAEFRTEVRNTFIKIDGTFQFIMKKEIETEKEVHLLKRNM